MSYCVRWKINDLVIRLKNSILIGLPFPTLPGCAPWKRVNKISPLSLLSLTASSRGSYELWRGTYFFSIGRLTLQGGNETSRMKLGSIFWIKNRTKYHLMRQTNSIVSVKLTDIPYFARNGFLLPHWPFLVHLFFLHVSIGVIIVVAMECTLSYFSQFSNMMPLPDSFPNTMAHFEEVTIWLYVRNLE